jgi:hypothetical protein
MQTTLLRDLILTQLHYTIITTAQQSLIWGWVSVCGTPLIWGWVPVCRTLPHMRVSPNVWDLPSCEGFDSYTITLRHHNNYTTTPHMRVSPSVWNPLHMRVSPSMWDPPSCERLLRNYYISVVNLIFLLCK